MSKNLRLKSFQPEEGYVYLTYSLKNNKKEESKILLENYKHLLHKALDWLWERTKIETVSYTHLTLPTIYSV